MSSIIFPGVCNFPANSKSTIRALAPIHKAYHSRRLSTSGIPSEKERKMGSTPKTATKKNKTLFDLFPPATAPSSKRFKSDSTASAIHSLSSPTNNDSSSAASTDLTAQQKSRIEFQKLLAKARRNLSICSNRVSHSKSKGEGVKLEELLVEGTWLEALPSELQKPYAKTLSKFVESELCGSVPIYPPTHLIFNALNSTSFDRVKAVILGQDPYHGPGQAMGLSFSVPEGVKVPSSLVNIFKELNKDLGCSIPSHGNLEKWAVQVVESCPTLVRDNVCYVLIWSWATPHIANWFYGGTSISSQGVLLLNAVLTVRNHQANSHAKKGWEQFTDAVIKTISEKRDGVVFLLWGNSAQQKIRLIDESKHHILKAAHPSGLSANRGFFGCRHFSRTNQLLEEMGIPPIDWQL